MPPERFDATIRVNESLGAESAEVMRHVMARAAATDVNVETRKAMKRILAKQILHPESQRSRRSSFPVSTMPGPSSGVSAW